MPGPVVQKLYLRELPPGLNMTITNVQPIMPTDNKKWKVEFDCNDGGRVSRNMDRPKEIAPGLQILSTSSDNIAGRSGSRLITVAPLTNIGVVTFGGYADWSSSGSGGKVEISIRIQGTATDENRNSRPVNEEGRISVWTSVWKGTERPDFTYVSYSPCGFPTTWSTGVPPDGQPAPAHFSFRVMGDGNEMSISSG